MQRITLATLYVPRRKVYRMPHQKINAADPRVLILRDRSSTFDPFFPQEQPGNKFHPLLPSSFTLRPGNPSTWPTFHIRPCPRFPRCSRPKNRYHGCRWKICSLISVLRCSSSASSRLSRPCLASLFLLCFVQRRACF